MAAWARQHRPDAVLLEDPLLLDSLETLSQVSGQLGIALLDVTDGEQKTYADVYQNSGEIGRVAIMALSSQINDRACGISPTFHHTLIEGRWVEGASLPPRS